LHEAKASHYFITPLTPLILRGVRINYTLALTLTLSLSRERGISGV